MKSTRLSFQRRAVGATSAVLFGLVIVAACSEDRAVGPRQVSIPAAAAGMRSAMPTITTEYVDYAKNLVGGGAFQIKDTLGVTLLTIIDDAANDGDKTPGKFQMSVPPGVYQLCETMPPPGYNFPAQQKSFCVKHTVLPNSSMHVGPYMVLVPYSAVWSTVAGFIPPNTPLWIGPSAFRITRSDGTFVMNVIDNGFKDLHSMLGIYYVKLPAPGDYVVCQQWEIPNYWMPNPRCHNVTVTFANVGWGDYFINPEKQVYVP
jgi:hypothetical protein